jgi:hypothetical protein
LRRHDHGTLPVPKGRRHAAGRLPSWLQSILAAAHLPH